MSGPVLDLVIAVHTVERPIRRAVASVLDSSDAGSVRVTVVCHGVPTTQIAPLLAGLRESDIRLLHHVDGVRSPAGPMNAGLAIAEAPYVAVMGSDDHFEPDALRAYLAVARSTEADVVIMPLRHQGGELLRNPLVRWRRRSRLDVVRDRLLYRSSPLALIRRQLLDPLPHPFVPGLPAGVDLELSAWLWTRGAHVEFPVSAPAYVISDDADDRVTSAPRPARAAMEPLERLLSQRWVGALPIAQRTALAIKTLRIHVLGAVRSRPAAATWGEGDLEAVRSVVQRCLALAPRALAPFALAERRILESLDHRGPAAVDAVVAAVSAESTARRRERILPRRLVDAVDRESTLTRYVLYRLDRWER